MEGVPIIASNMDGVGEIDLAKNFHRKLMTALTKQHTTDQVASIYKRNEISNFLALSCGTNLDSFNRLNKILKKHPKLQFICIDVANGYLKILVILYLMLEKNIQKKQLLLVML